MKQIEIEAVEQKTNRLKIKADEIKAAIDIIERIEDNFDSRHKVLCLTYDDSGYYIQKTNHYLDSNEITVSMKIPFSVDLTNLEEMSDYLFKIDHINNLKTKIEKCEKKKEISYRSIELNKITIEDFVTAANIDRAIGEKYCKEFEETAHNAMAEMTHEITILNEELKHVEDALKKEFPEKI